MASGRQIRAGRAFVEFGGNDAALQRVLKRVAARISSFGRTITGIGARLTALAGAITAPFAAATGIFASTGDSLEKLARRTGFTVEALSTLGFAAQQSGSSVEALQTAARGMFNAIQQLERGSAEYVEAFDQIGLSMAQLKGLNPEQQFKLIADRLSQVADFATRAAIAQDIFGRSGQQLLPLLEDGAAGIELLQRRARELNLEIDTDAAKQAAELTDRLNELKQVALNIAFRIGEALGGTVADLAKRFAEAGSRVIEFVRENRELILTVVRVGLIIGAAGAALITLGGTLILVGASISALATIVGLASTVFAGLAAAIGLVLSPIGLVVAAIAGIGIAFARSTDAVAGAGNVIRSAFGSIIGTAGKAIEGVRNALAGGDISLAVRIVWLAIQLEFQKGIAYVGALWQDFKDSIVAVWQTVSEPIIAAWRVVVDFLSSSLDTAADLIGEAITGIADFFAPVIAFIIDAWETMTSFLQENFSETFEFIGEIVSEIGDVIIDIANAVKAAWDGALSAIRSALGESQSNSGLAKAAGARVARVALIAGGEQPIEENKPATPKPSPAEDRVAEAQRRLDDALAQAAESAQRQREAVAAANLDLNANPYQNYENIPQRPVAASQEGLFNTAGIRSLLGSPELDKQTRLAEKNLDALKALLRETKKRQEVAVWAN